MNNKILISIIVVILVVVGLIIFKNNSKKNTNPNPVNNLENNEKENRSEILIDGDFSFSPSESKIKWEGRKTLIENWVDAGTIAVASGEIKISEGVLTSGNIIIDMNSISATKTGANSGEDKLSSHLKSADFFDVLNYPTSEFKMTSISLNEDKTYKIAGDLTIKGITKNIEIPVSVYTVNDKMLIDGNIIVNRADFNIRYGSKSFFNDLGDKVIDDNFTLNLNLVATKQ